ncbi:MAG: hypothetical protein ACQGVK_19835 [Myxococcota bacterium]
MRITFLLSTVGHPRHRKRMRSLRRLGADTSALAFAREGHLRDDETPNLRILGEIGHEEVLKRVTTLARALRVVRESARHSDVLYTFGPDQLALARLAVAGLRPRPRLVVEIGDLHPLLVSGRPVARAGRAVERMMMRGDVLLVSTSPAFVEKYYREMLGMKSLRSLVIENKVDPDVTPEPLPRDRDESGPIRIGWFGLLRCERSWEVLSRVAREGEGRVRVILRGMPMARLADLAERVERVPNMEFGGRYSVPDDLPGMYGGVDLCWMVHHDTERPYESWGWARSNRLYQAGWFRTPIVGQSDKDDSTVLREHDLGMTIDVTDADASVAALLAVTRQDVARWRDRFEAVPRSVFALGDEHERLMELLRS